MASQSFSTVQKLSAVLHEFAGVENILPFLEASDVLYRVR